MMVANIWTTWLDVLGTALNVLASDIGLGLGLSIICMTVLLRITLLPLSWSAAYANTVRQKKMKHIQPQLEALKTRHAGNPEAYSRELVKLYESHGLKVMDGKNMLGALVQLPVFMGMFQLLRGLAKGGRFIWVSDLLKPNAVLAVIVALSTALTIAVNPDMPEQMKMLMIAVAGVITLASALHFGSALALYWTTSNLFSTLQTLAVHGLVNRRIRAGAIKL
jgi:YidC/Oxa1 family membrane protein insertase